MIDQRGLPGALGLKGPRATARGKGQSEKVN